MNRVGTQVGEPNRRPPVHESTAWLPHTFALKRTGDQRRDVRWHERRLHGVHQPRSHVGNRDRSARDTALRCSSGRRLVMCVPALFDCAHDSTHVVITGPLHHTNAERIGRVGREHSAQRPSRDRDEADQHDQRDSARPATPSAVTAPLQQPNSSRRGCQRPLKRPQDQTEVRKRTHGPISLKFFRYPYEPRQRIVARLSDSLQSSGTAVT